MFLKRWGVGGGGVSMLAVSLKSCRGEPVLKKGGGCCAPVGGICLSQRLLLTLRRACRWSSGEVQSDRKALILKTEAGPGKYSADP